MDKANQRKRNTNCPKGKEGCSITQELRAELNDISPGLGQLDVLCDLAQKQINEKLNEVDSTVESFQKGIDEKLKEVAKTVSSIQAQNTQQSKDDREYFRARTAQIGLFAIRESRRIVRSIHAKTREKIGAVDFDIYGIDKYFGADYPDCITHIWKIKELCHKYDKSFDDSESQMGVLTGEITECANLTMVKIRDILRDTGLIDRSTEVLELKDTQIIKLMGEFRKQIQETISSKIS